MDPSCPDVNLAEKTLLRKTIFACAQVSKLWRHAARSYSPLWPHSIDFQNHPPEVVKDLLPLSRPHPIHVGHRSAPFLMVDGKSLDILLQLEHDRARIREWNVQVHPAFYNLAGTRRTFGSIAWQTSRSVETLRWSGVAKSCTGFLPVISSSLRKLQLHNTDVEVRHWMDLSNLTELSVANTATDGIKYSLTEWFALLRGTHRLRFLELRDAMHVHSELDDTLAQPPNDIVLPELRLVSLAESTAIAALMILALCVTIDKPHTCCINLDLPSPTELACEEGLDIDDIREMFAHIAASMHDYANHTQPNESPVPPRLEILAQSLDSGIQFTLGTVLNPVTTLNWNGVRGTEGVESYIDDYFGGDTFPSPLPRHPPFSVTIHNPYAEDVLHTSILSSLSLVTATTVRIAIDSYLSQSAHLDQIVDGILGTLSRADEARTLLLNKGAFVALVPTLYQLRYMATLDPFLPKLKYILVESMTSRPDIGAVEDEVWEIMLNYVQWRNSIGFPVEVLWCARDGGADD